MLLSFVDNKDGKAIGSKDLWDSLASAIYSAQISISEGDEYGYNYTYRKQSNIIEHMSHDPREESRKIAQSMLEDIF